MASLFHYLRWIVLAFRAAGTADVSPGATAARLWSVFGAGALWLVLTGPLTT